MGNIYVLKLRNERDIKINVGSLGDIKFEKGWYGYVGSSRSDKFKRVDRHIQLSRGDSDTRHWHIDYLITHPCVTIDSYFKHTDSEECVVSNSVDLEGIESFGCSDCNCETHLYYHEQETEFDEKIRDAFDSGYDYQTVNNRD